MIFDIVWWKFLLLMGFAVGAQYVFKKMDEAGKKVEKAEKQFEAEEKCSSS